MNQPIPIVITGPTGVGKSELGIKLAGEFEGEIVSVDSRQIYRHLDIGTAKPTTDERKRVVHHFIDIRDPDEYYSAGQYAREARAILRSLQSRGIRPIITGGSGLYLSALIDGLFDSGQPDAKVRRELKDRLETEGLPALHRELGRRDPVLQSKLSPNDSKRILRALEVAIATSFSASHHFRHQRETALPCLSLMFGLHRDRTSLYGRIEERVESMMRNGWVEETRRLLEMYDRGCVGLQTLGYKELARHLRDKTDLGDELSTIKRRSRRYAKSQTTWLKKDRRLRWLDLDRYGMTGAHERVATQVHSDVCEF